jgi:hypothetical protein
MEEMEEMGLSHLLAARQLIMQVAGVELVMQPEELEGLEEGLMEDQRVSEMVLTELPTRGAVAEE